MRVRYTPRAERDLARIVSYLDERAADVTPQVVRRIRERATQLTDFPFIGPPTNRPGIRSLTVVPYPYKLYYRVGANEIAILHIRDGRRAPWKGAE
jgi:plasmid stabilization system protein ParE